MWRSAIRGSIPRKASPHAAVLYNHHQGKKALVWWQQAIAFFYTRLYRQNPSQWLLQKIRRLPAARRRRSRVRKKTSSGAFFSSNIVASGERKQKTFGKVFVEYKSVLGFGKGKKTFCCLLPLLICHHRVSKKKGSFCRSACEKWRCGYVFSSSFSKPLSVDGSPPPHFRIWEKKPFLLRK